MEMIESFLAPIILGVVILNNLITVIEGFATGKIKSYTRSLNFRIFGEKPVEEYSLNFDTTYFWIEVVFNLFYILLGTLVLYLTFFR